MHNGFFGEPPLMPLSSLRNKKQKLAKISRKLYTDDYVQGVNTEEEAKELIAQSY